MSRKKLINQLKQKNPQLNQSEIENIIDIFSKSIISALKNNKKVEIRGLGKWYLRKFKENYNLRNPKTNELIYRPERVKIKFKPSKKLSKIIEE